MSDAEKALLDLEVTIIKFNEHMIEMSVKNAELRKRLIANKQTLEELLNAYKNSDNL